jgi:hypothetical protein
MGFQQKPSYKPAPMPYGPAYCDLVRRVAIEHGCGIGPVGVLLFIWGKTDWKTGIMSHQLSHKALAKEVGVKSYNTVQKYITQLKAAGVIADHRRGNNYDGGEANTYKFKIAPPTQNLGTPPNTPPQNLGTPPPKKDGDPTPKNGVVNPDTFLSEGDADSPSRAGEGNGPFFTWHQIAGVRDQAWVNDTLKRTRMVPENPVTFTDLARVMNTDDARSLWRALEQKEDLRSAMNEGRKKENAA